MARLACSLWLVALAATIALCTSSVIAAFPIYRSVDSVVEAVESSRKVSAVLIVSSAQDDELRLPKRKSEEQDTDDKEDANGGVDGDETVGSAHADADAHLMTVLSVKFPHLQKIIDSLDTTVEFVVADIEDTKTVVKKWNLPTMPALLLYKDAPKSNPYTGKTYREAAVTHPAILEHPTKLKKLLKDSIPASALTEWNEAAGFKSLADVDAYLKTQFDNGDKVVLLISKQKTPSHLYRALALEMQPQGLAFAYLHQDDAVAKAFGEKWNIESFPTLLVLSSPSEHTSLPESKMKKYAHMKEFLTPFARLETEGGSVAGDKTVKSTKKAKNHFITSENFDQMVLESRVAWIISFLDDKAEEQFDKGAMVKMAGELRKKMGVITVGAVRCNEAPELCEKYGGPGIRVFPIKVGENKSILREDMLPKKFSSIEDAKDAALKTIPDTVHVMGSAVDLNAFLSRALSAKALPAILVTKKTETPTMLKALALSFPSQNIAFGVISDADPQVRQQFGLTAKSSAAFLCLVAVDKTTQQPQEGASPFGILAYDKNTMGSYTYPNLVRFMMNVVMQYPHPLAEQDPLQGEGASTSSTVDDSSAPVDVPYLKKDNLKQLCDGNKICAIGFFEGHASTLDDETSALSQHMNVLRSVATSSKKQRQPFHFMWTNGKCQAAFAEAFGVGAFQMPTVVVYSPSKQRYATNVGLFDEENTANFLKSVLSGKLPTIPVSDVPELRAECSLEEVNDEIVASGDADDDEDLGDLLSEILGEEERSRKAREDALRAERDAKKKTKSGGDKKSKKKKKKKSKKSSARDEL
ncbi:hypothetical protein PINS_up004512 [Pythium insidiosum]|nr:hypothetical protein PINS_up004512 [Pythium insidiosum]